MRIAVLPVESFEEDVLQKAGDKGWKWPAKGHQIEETQAEDKTRSDEEAYNIYSNSRLFRAMRPLFWSLTIFGMYFTRKYGPLKECCHKVKSCKTGESYAKPRRKKRVTASMIYAWCLFVAYAVFYLRLFSMFAVGDLAFGTELLNKLIIVAWFTITMVTFIMCMRASYRYEGIPRFFVELDHMTADLPSSTFDQFEQYLRKAVWRVVSFVWLFIIISIILVSYAITLYPALVEPLFAPLTVHHPHIVIIQILAGLFQPLANALWSFGLATDFIFSYILYGMFKCWSDRFRAKCSAGITSAEFEQEQINHQKLCRLVGHVDDFLSLYKASAFTANIAILLFIAYNLIYLPAHLREPTIIFFHITWLIVAAICLMSTCISGVMVNSVVSRL